MSVSPHTSTVSMRRRMTTWFVLLLLTTACTPLRQLVYTPSELKAELRRRTPELPEDKLLVPYDVPQWAVEKAKTLLNDVNTTKVKARLLKQALFDPNEFGIRYTETATRTATQTLRDKEGNCFGLASLFIGLARALGMDARYMDVSNHTEEARRDKEVMVRVGHITAVVQTPSDIFALNFGYQLRRYKAYRVMDDLEAVAHFYNNRGYELIYLAQSRDAPVDWKAVSDSFETATQIIPDFARAWNNFGVAQARLGNFLSAEAHYKTAIAHDPTFVSPYTNLGVLYFSSNNLAKSIELLTTSIGMDAQSPHVHYHLGIALLRNHELERAAAAIERTIQLQDDYPNAQAVLLQIQRRRENAHMTNSDPPIKTAGPRPQSQ